MKTFLATLLVSGSLVSCGHPAFAQPAAGCYDVKQTVEDADTKATGWTVEQTLKDVNEDGDMYSSVLIFSNPKFQGAHLVAWFQDECLVDYNVVSSDFVQEYIEKFVR